MIKLICLLFAGMFLLTACSAKEPKIEATPSTATTATTTQLETVKLIKPDTAEIIENPISDFQYHRTWGGIEITKYIGTSTVVKIPNEIEGEPVTAIGYMAFSEETEGSTTIIEVHFPDSLLFIGERAFYMCEGLKSVTLPESVRRIHYNAFAYCNNLTSILLSEELTYIGGSAFYGCEKLADIILPNNLLTIANSAFANCKLLQNITIPESVSYLGENAFDDLQQEVYDLINGTEEQNLIPFELLNYKKDDVLVDVDELHIFDGTGGGYHFTIENWTLLTDNDIIREYFYGIWGGFSWWDNGRNINDNGFLIIDDSEKCNIQRSFEFNGYYQVNENVLAAISSGNAGECYFYWLDMANPDVMYYLTTSFYSMDKDENYTYKIYTNGALKLIKTDRPLNQPQNGFMSKIALEDMADRYGIDRKLLNTFEGNGYLRTIDRLEPCFLISEEPDKIILKVELFTMAGETPITINTIEKIDGEWVRTVEVV